MTEISFRRDSHAAWLSAAAKCGYLVLGGIIAWWTWRAFHDPRPWDTGLAYQAGQLAWATGHPERLSTWNGAPLLALTFALLSRLANTSATADLMIAVNAALAVTAVAVVLARLRPLVPRAWWWVIAAGLVSFAPLMSTVWWKQFSVIALVSALGGYELLRRDRVHLGAIAIAVSISFKPLAILLPFALLLRRETRRAGILALVWVAAIDVASQAFLAWRASDIGTLDPTIAIRNFAHKTNPVGDVFMCHPTNFAPSSLLCRSIGGPTEWQLQRVAVYLGVLLLACWTLDALRARRPLDWGRFAFACAISLMVSPIEWAHYEIMLAPLFVVLVVRFVRDGARWPVWLGLLVAFVLASLIWEPYGSIIDAIRRTLGDGDNAAQLTVLDGIAQFVQYVLVLTGVIWYGQSRAGPEPPALGELGGGQGAILRASK